ncbi:MAG: hypothetical protein M1824_005342 [Vezdaea acicularis]|nr:MAG: hypothetical protein M1824_005342 [Vezdaea acicularis]
MSSNGAAANITIQNALDIVRSCNGEQVDPAVTALLNQFVAEIWQRIGPEPSSYILTQLEFAVFNFYQDRFREYPAYRAAIGRFWTHYGYTGQNGAAGAQS